MDKKRILTLLLVIIVTASIASAATTWVASGSFVSGAAAVWNNSTSEFQSSGTDTNGLIFTLDGNTVCFNGTTCDVNVDWNGTDIIVNGWFFGGRKNGWR